MHTIITFNLRILAACGLALILLPSAAQAADPLHWKFTPGLTNRYRMTQNTKLAMNTGPGGNVQTDSKMTLDLSWTVEEVDDDGSAVLNQRIDRMQMKISTGAGQSTEIDSASDEPPQGQAATLVPLVKALTAEPFTVTMTPRGEITDVNVPESIVEALKNQPGAAQMGDLATPEGFKKLVAQASFVLPEKLAPGVEWKTKTATQAPSIGTQTAETTYRYEGPKEIDGQPLEVFSAKIAVSFAGGQLPIEVTKQESSGQILFNREAGRLESSNIKQLTNVKITVGDNTVDQTIDQNVEMKWVPEKE
jgi:hypothetical protein